MDIEKKTLDYIRSENLIKKGERILVAVSGGKDSMALLYFLNKFKSLLKIKLFVCNMNHSLRGEEGDKENKIIKEFCSLNDIRYKYKICNIREIKSESNAKSLEEISREQRYKFFEECKDFFSADKVALAHHLDDLIETVIFRMIKGTGLNGLLALKPQREFYIRPFLLVNVQEIKNYVTINMIKFNEDRTNHDTVFERNYIRHKIVPHFERINSQYKEAFLRLYKNLNDSYAIIEDSVENLKSKFRKLPGKLFINKNEIRSYKDQLISEVLRNIIRDLSENHYPPTRERIVGAVHKIRETTDKKWVIEIFRNISIMGSGDYVFILNNNEQNFKKKILIDEIPFELSYLFGKIYLQNYKNVLEIDGKKNSVIRSEKLVLPLKFRNIENNDYIIPFGSRGRKRIKKILQEKGIQGFVDELMILENGNGDILWVPGVISSELCRVKNYEEKNLAFFRFERRSPFEF
ncbi:MAG: tRNA(Ile)-lysidine synthase [Kosmotogales bacterium]|nr:tRNA(Ile)-lysidine synthase [Kosmotogales bacterium]